MLIFLVTEHESFPVLIYDHLIQKHSPDNFLLIINTENKEVPWKDEELIGREVNNFIEIIKEDLKVVGLEPPKLRQKGLLTDNYEDGSIFNVLDLMETTQWANMKRVGEKNKQKQVEKQGK